VIETKGLSRYYGRLAAVQDLDLEVRPGELFGFLGPNGAGKTTTLRLLIGLLRPTAGTARIAGHDVQREPRQAKRATGYLPDAPYLYDKLTGREHLRFVGGLYGLSDGEVEGRLARLLALVELADRAGELVETYSHGMRQRLALAAALIHEPAVLLMDEPFSGLDPRSTLRVKEVLRTLAGQGATVLLSTHTLEIAERICDRVGILDRGRLVAVGTMGELRAQARADGDSTLEDLFIQLTGGEAVADVVRLLSNGER
jgi:ABC-2 type transport system ATP-binding protein